MKVKKAISISLISVIFAFAEKALWQSSIQSNQRLQSAKYKNVLLNGSIGYNWKLGTHFYFCPWAGMHPKVGGASTVSVDNVSFDTPLLTPEASVKLGWIF